MPHAENTFAPAGRFLRIGGGLALIFILALRPLLGAAESRPNIVFILADDLGWGDVAFHGGPAPTPHLDRLAREGMELRQHYVAATCSPTRAGLLGGRWWSRFGIRGPDSRRAFTAESPTLPRALKALGYETALMGKWHLGSRPDWGPNHHGFDHAYGSLGGGVGPWEHSYKRGEYERTWHRNGTFVSEPGHVTDLIAREAVQWIRARGQAPFFLYLPFTAVHLPLKEPAEWVERVPAAIRDPVARHYAASIMHLDDAVGRILAALEQAGHGRNTLVIFTSDNGGSTAENADPAYPADDYPAGPIPGRNLPWRGRKGELYEGGIRVPTIAHWPGRLPARPLEVPAHVVDWMTTLRAAAGEPAPTSPQGDGVNLWPLLTGRSDAAPERALYWTTPRASAVRLGAEKLIVHAGRGGAPAKVELFDLAADPHETTDLASQRPARVAALQQVLAKLAAGDAPPRAAERD